MQACILIVHALFERVRSMECFFIVAVLARGIGPTGINKLGDGGSGAPLVAVPSDPVDEHERRMIMWHAYLGASKTSLSMLAEC